MLEDEYVKHIKYYYIQIYTYNYMYIIYTQSQVNIEPMLEGEYVKNNDNNDDVYL